MSSRRTESIKMKLSLTLPALLLALDGTSASSARKRNAAKKLVRNARRLQNNYNYNNGANNNNNNNGQSGDEGEPWYLADYSLKLINCLQGEQSYNQEREVEGSTVIFRLCPRDTCGANNSTSSLGCDEGYGDFAVGINTFTQAYMESMKDNYNGGMQYYSSYYGEFNVEEYVNECRLFEEENEENNQNYGSYNYIGAACTSDGTDIRLASFSDPYCSTESDVAFEDTHNGFALPYSDGGLVPNTCISCLTTTENYEYEINEMCQQTYEDSTYRCEENMESYSSYYGPVTSGCEYLEDKVPSASFKETTDSWAKKSGNLLKKGGNLFSNQPENVKMAEEGVALLVVMILLSFFGVGYLLQKMSTKEGKAAVNKFTESTKSAAMLVKVSAMGAASKVSTAIKKSNCNAEGFYFNMGGKKKGREVADC